MMCSPFAGADPLGHIDQQGFKVRIGIAYLRIVGMPGPDVSAVVIDKLNDDGTVDGFDPVFSVRCESIKTGELWRPLKYKWEGKLERDHIVKYASEAALDLS